MGLLACLQLIILFKKRKDREQQLLLIWIELSLNGILIILFWYLYHRSAKWKHHNWTAQYWQEHGPILVEEPWQFTLEASTRLVIISLNARFISGPAREVIEWGCSWPGVFLLGASGCTGRFFTQLLFHHPHSLSSFCLVHINGEVCVPQLFKQVRLGSQVPGLRFLGLSFHWMSGLRT